MAYKPHIVSADPTFQTLQDYQLAYNTVEEKLLIKNTDKNKVQALNPKKAVGISDDDFFEHADQLPNGYYNVTGQDSKVHYIPTSDANRTTVTSWFSKSDNTNLEPSQYTGAVVGNFYSVWAQDSRYFYGFIPSNGVFGQNFVAINKETKKEQFIQFPAELIWQTTSGSFLNSNTYIPSSGSTVVGYYPRVVYYNHNTGDVYAVLRKVTRTNPGGTAWTATTDTGDSKLLRVWSSSTGVISTAVLTLPSVSVWWSRTRNTEEMTSGNSGILALKYGTCVIGNYLYMFPTGDVNGMKGTKCIRLSGSTIDQIEMNAVVSLPTSTTGDKSYQNTVTNDGTNLLLFPAYNEADLKGSKCTKALKITGTTATAITLTADFSAAINNNVGVSTYCCDAIRGTKRIYTGSTVVKSASNTDVIKHNKIITIDAANGTQTVLTLPRSEFEYSNEPYRGQFNLPNIPYSHAVDNPSNPTKMYIISYPHRIVTYNLEANTATVSYEKKYSWVASGCYENGNIWTLNANNPGTVVRLHLADMSVKYTSVIGYSLRIMQSFIEWNGKIVIMTGASQDIGYFNTGTGWNGTANYFRKPMTSLILTFNKETGDLEKSEHTPLLNRASPGIYGIFRPEYSSRFRIVSAYWTSAQAWSGVYNYIINHDPFDIQSYPQPSNCCSNVPDWWKFNDGTYFLGANLQYVAYLKKEQVTVPYKLVNGEYKNLGHPMFEVMD
jgi:hypothetical protein